MDDLLTCSNCGCNDFMPVVRMQQRGNHSLSSPSSNWAGVKCFECGTFYDDTFIGSYLNNKCFK